MLLWPAFLLHLSCALVMTGVIWFVQVVHYPLLAWVPAKAFAAYAERHQRWVTYLVGPIMVLEVASGLFILVNAQWHQALWLINIGLLAGIWLSTLLLQIPQHAALARGWDETAHRRLVTSNWIRTALWTLRAAGLLYWLGLAISAAD